MKNILKFLLLVIIFNVHAGEVDIDFRSDSILTADHMNTIKDAINDNNTKAQSITPSSNSLFPPSFVGNIADTSSVWERPASCNDLGPVDFPDPNNPALFFYRTHELLNLSNEDKPFTVTANWTSSTDFRFDPITGLNFDGYLYVYDENGFDATAPLNNCIGVNDDFISISYSKISGLSVPANSSVTIVTTHISRGNTIPSYTLHIYEGVSDIP